MDSRSHRSCNQQCNRLLVFLVEGEEESGSEHLETFVAANRQRLACDAVIVSDSAQFAAGVPAITAGWKMRAWNTPMACPE